MSEVRAEEGLQAEAREDEEVPRRLGMGALAHDAAIYGGVRVLLKSLAFLLVPLYARYLSPAEFGTLELILAFAAFVDVFINLSGVLARFYFDQDDSRWRKQAITLFFLIESVYPAVLIGGLLLFASRLADPIAGDAVYASLIVIALIDLYLTNIVDISMSLTRLRRKPWTFALYALIRGLTYVIMAVLLVAVWELGVKGIMIASLTAAILVFVVSAREYVGDLIRGVDWNVGREMVAFGWPTIVSAFSFYALNLLDRFFVKHYHGAAETGLYGVAFRYSQIVLIGVFAFRMGWPQWHYSWLNTDRHPQMVARGASWFFGALGFLVVLVSAWILPLFHLLMPPRYWEASEAVAPLVDRGDGDGRLRGHGGRAERDEADAADHPHRLRRRARRGRALLPADPAVRLRRRGVGHRGRSLVGGALRRDRLAADLPGAVGLAARRPGRRGHARAGPRLAGGRRPGALRRLVAGARRDHARLPGGAAPRRLPHGRRAPAPGRAPAAPLRPRY